MPGQTQEQDNFYRLDHKTYEKASAKAKPTRTIVYAYGVPIGDGKNLTLIAGPCAVESEKQLFQTAKAAAASGARLLRGGAYKPSTSPYGFQGLGKEGLELLKEARKQYNIGIVTEVMDTRKVELVSEYADMLQIGARSMQNYDLLKEVGRSKKPVLLKRAMTATYQEWLLAAEYILLQGNDQIVLCERGIRTFETYTRNTLDLAAIPAMKELSHLPIIVDPSQGTGRRELVGPMSLAAIACGADGVMIEVHPDPDQAFKDGHQSINFNELNALFPQLCAIASVAGKSFL